MTAWDFADMCTGALSWRSNTPAESSHTGSLDMLSLWQLEPHWAEAAYVTPQDMSQHAQTCFKPLIAFFPA